MFRDIWSSMALTNAERSKRLKSNLSRLEINMVKLVDKMFGHSLRFPTNLYNIWEKENFKDRRNVL